MTNFRISQTERFCRRQFQIGWKWQKVCLTGWKHCGKRRNCSLRAISAFPTVFFNRLILETYRNEGLIGKGFNIHKTCSHNFNLQFDTCIMDHILVNVAVWVCLFPEISIHVTMYLHGIFRRRLKLGQVHLLAQDLFDRSSWSCMLLKLMQISHPGKCL